LFVPDAVALMGDARAAGRRVGVLSNEAYTFIGRDFFAGRPEFAELDAFVDATELGARKPAPESYLAAAGAARGGRGRAGRPRRHVRRPRRPVRPHARLRPGPRPPRARRLMPSSRSGRGIRRQDPRFRGQDSLTLYPPSAMARVSRRAPALRMRAWSLSWS